MFMEYCDTGTIEEAAKMGLPEYLIRRYTREIVLAVNHLHENSIVHRDIKGKLYFLPVNTVLPPSFPMPTQVNVAGLKKIN